MSRHPTRTLGVSITLVLVMAGCTSTPAPLEEISTPTTVLDVTSAGPTTTLDAAGRLRWSRSPERIAAALEAATGCDEDGFWSPPGAWDQDSFRCAAGPVVITNSLHSQRVIAFEVALEQASATPSGESCVGLVVSGPWVTRIESPDPSNLITATEAALADLGTPDLVAIRVDGCGSSPEGEPGIAALVGSLQELRACEPIFTYPQASLLEDAGVAADAGDDPDFSFMCNPRADGTLAYFKFADRASAERWANAVVAADVECVPTAVVGSYVVRSILPYGGSPLTSDQFRDVIADWDRAATFACDD